MKLKEWGEIQGVSITQMLQNKRIGHLTCVVIVRVYLSPSAGSQKSG